MKLRSLLKMIEPNDSTRTLVESIMVPEIVKALEDWKDATRQECVLIGGLALSFYVKPRMTQDCDFLFLSAADIPDQVAGFKRVRPHAFQHNKTHVEIEALDPEFLQLPSELVKQVMDTAQLTDGVRVASKEGLIVSKLKRFSRQDQADIEALINVGASLDDSWSLPAGYRKKYESIRDDSGE